MYIFFVDKISHWFEHDSQQDYEGAYISYIHRKYIVSLNYSHTVPHLCSCKLRNGGFIHNFELLIAIGNNVDKANSIMP